MVTEPGQPTETPASPGGESPGVGYLSGEVALPMELLGQGEDVDSFDGQCPCEVRVLEYPFERRPDEEDGAYAWRLGQRYRELMRVSQFMQRHFPNDTVVHVDATRDVDAVAEEVLPHMKVLRGEA